MSERPRFPRSTCCVVGCHHWSTVFPGEWMCADHWRSLPPIVRRLLRRSWRRQREARALYEAQPVKRTWQSDLRRWDAGERLWVRAKRIATEKAAGL